MTVHENLSFCGKCEGVQCYSISRHFIEIKLETLYSD